MAAVADRLLMPTEAPAGAALVSLKGHRCLIVHRGPDEWMGAYYWPTEDAPTVRKIESTAQAGNPAAAARLAGMPMHRSASKAATLLGLLMVLMPGDDLGKDRRELELYLGMHRQLQAAA